ncbi:hypothetical protein [Nocardia nova]
MPDNRFEEMAAELDAALAQVDGWARATHRERAGYSVFALHTAGELSAQVVSNLGMFPEWSWTVYRQGRPLTASTAPTAAAAIEHATAALRAA